MGVQVVMILRISYETEDIEKYIQISLMYGDFSVVTLPEADGTIHIKPINSTLRSRIKRNREFNFKKKNCIGQLSGVTSCILEVGFICSRHSHGQRSQI